MQPIDESLDLVGLLLLLRSTRARSGNSVSKSEDEDIAFKIQEECARAYLFRRANQELFGKRVLHVLRILECTLRVAQAFLKDLALLTNLRVTKRNERRFSASLRSLRQNFHCLASQRTSERRWSHQLFSSPCSSSVMSLGISARAGAPLAWSARGLEVSTYAAEVEERNANISERSAR